LGHRQLFRQFGPPVKKAEQVVALCSGLWPLSLNERQRDQKKRGQTLRVEVYVGRARDKQDDRFLSRCHHRAMTTVEGILEEFDIILRNTSAIEVAKDVQEYPITGKRTLVVDIDISEDH
jgi:hypothetical protein